MSQKFAKPIIVKPGFSVIQILWFILVVIYVLGLVVLPIVNADRIAKFGFHWLFFVVIFMDILLVYLVYQYGRFLIRIQPNLSVHLNGHQLMIRFSTGERMFADVIAVNDHPLFCRYFYRPHDEQSMKSIVNVYLKGKINLFYDALEEDDIKSIRMHLYELRYNHV